LEGHLAMSTKPEQPDVPRRTGSAGKSFAMAIVAYVVLMVAFGILRGSMPSPEQFGRNIANAFFAAIIVAFISRNKHWSWIGTGIFVFLATVLVSLISSSIQDSKRPAIVAQQNQHFSEFLKIQNDLLDVLETVKDPETARAAVPKIDQLTKRLQPVVQGMTV